MARDGERDRDQFAGKSITTGKEGFEVQTGFPLFIEATAKPPLLVLLNPCSASQESLLMGRMEP